MIRPHPLPALAGDVADSTQQRCGSPGAPGRQIGVVLQPPVSDDDQTVRKIVYTQCGVLTVEIGCGFITDVDSIRA